jgi:hypothetical protein
MAQYTTLFADLATNVLIGEYRVSELRFTKVLNGSGAVVGVIKLGDPSALGKPVREDTMPARRAVYVLRDHAPMWGGIIWATDYDSESHELTFGGADWWSYFDHRRILNPLTLPLLGYAVAGDSVIYTAVDQNDIARGLVALAQSHTGGNIGVTADSNESGVAMTREYDGFELKPTGQALRDLTNLLNGPDIVFDVGQLVNGVPTRLMITGTPLLIQPGDPVMFDLGGNLQKIIYSVGGGTMVTRAFVSGAGQDRGTLIAASEDTTRYANGWPLLEFDDAHQDVSVLATLQTDADSIVGAAATPPISIQMTVRGDLTPRLGSYELGAVAKLVVPPLRTAADDQGLTRIVQGDPYFPGGLNLSVRITGLDVAVADDSGVETVTVTSYPYGN